jgi:hypothetical protein
MAITVGDACSIRRTARVYYAPHHRTQLRDAVSTWWHAICSFTTCGRFWMRPTPQCRRTLTKWRCKKMPTFFCAPKRFAEAEN